MVKSVKSDSDVWPISSKGQKNNNNRKKKQS